MAGYAGSELQRKLQQRADENAEWISATPGACNIGRMLGTDDADRLGWATVFDILERDTVFGFRLIPAGKVEETRARLAERGYRLDFWDMFTAEAATAKAAIEPILERPLPGGLRHLDLGTDPEGPRVRALQEFLLAAGIAPFSGSLLLGQPGPAAAVVLGDAEDAIVACAHTYMPHNAYSPYRRFGWGGLVAVSPEHRGKGLGLLVNALMLRIAFDKFQAESVYEMVSEGNLPSRRMVEACGLRLDPKFRSGSANAGATRFTK